MDILIDQFELEETGRFRAVPSADDVVRILYHHWVLNDDYFPEERQRFQLAIMDIFCASTTARAGTVVESSCYLVLLSAVLFRIHACVSLSCLFRKSSEAATMPLCSHQALMHSSCLLCEGLGVGSR